MRLQLIDQPAAEPRRDSRGSGHAPDRGHHEHDHGGPPDHTLRHDLGHDLHAEVPNPSGRGVGIFESLPDLVAHELNNPLHIIAAFARLAQRTAVPEQKRARYLEIICQSVERCSEVVHQLAEASLDRPPRAEEVIDLEALGREVLTRIGRSDTHTFAVTKTDVAPCCQGERRLIDFVLYQLVQAATEAVCAGGQVQMSVTCDQDNIYVFVEDSGARVRGALRSDAQAPQFSLAEGPRSRVEGASISLCRAVAQRHGGNILVTDSVRLGGALFVLTLPAYHAPKTLDSDRGRTASSPDR
ncbi:MAG: HAMP domain-containing histidine kinase [Deltaproteobacteria bacterium]|nr:HAMP domain-containing histidine kinase [Deltaproteobacteria bacterium]